MHASMNRQKLRPIKNLCPRVLLEYLVGYIYLLVPHYKQISNVYLVKELIMCRFMKKLNKNTIITTRFRQKL